VQHKHGIATDQLNNILQVIQLGHKTGHLTVKRTIGPLSEEGEIVFLHGQITFARCGNHNGESALQQFSTWGPCRFIFVNTASSTKIPTTDPLHSLALSSSDISRISTNPHLETPHYNAVENNQHTTGSLPAVQSISLVPQRICDTEEGLQRLTQAHFTRQHRNLYLLINGIRSFTELVRLMGKKPDEVYRLLLDLEHIGIIQS
jgi:Domain of unknown function (DUF4388)